MGQNMNDMKLHLLVLAKGAQEKSHAPYSNFKVGAAIETEGAYAIGCNVENAVYPLCICAERAAIANMVLNGHKTALSIAVIGQLKLRQEIETEFYKDR